MTSGEALLEPTRAERDAKWAAMDAVEKVEFLRGQHNALIGWLATTVPNLAGRIEQLEQVEKPVAEPPLRLILGHADLRAAALDVVNSAQVRGRGVVWVDQDCFDRLAKIVKESEG